MAAVKARGNVTLTYGSAITSYVNQADLSGALDTLDATVLNSTGTVQIANTTTWEIACGGPWESALDTIIAVDAVTPGTKRTTVVTYSSGAGATVTYTWTAAAAVGGEISNYQITAAPDGLIAWTATLMISGAPVRTVA